MATRDSRLGTVDRLATPLVLIAVLIGVGLAASFAAPALQRTVMEAVIKLIAVVGMWIFIGNSGVMSFGHVSFMAIGGYASALLTMAPVKKAVLLDLPDWLEALTLPGLVAGPAAALVAAMVALVIGLGLMRLRGIALPMSTFAVLAIVHVVALNWREVTGGRQALVGLPRLGNLWIPIIAAALAIIAAALYRDSRRGLLLRCSRENEVAAAAMGVDITRERLLAFVLSAFFAGLAGLLYAHLLGTITATTFYLDLTFVTLSMLVVGGMRSLTGAFAGVLLVSVMVELLRMVEKGVAVGPLTLSLPLGSQEIVLALVLAAVLIFRPDGLLGDREIRWTSRRRLPRPAAGMPPLAAQEEPK